MFFRFLYFFSETFISFIGNGRCFPGKTEGGKGLDLQKLLNFLKLIFGIKIMVKNISFIVKVVYCNNIFIDLVINIVNSGIIFFLPDLYFFEILNRIISYVSKKAIIDELK